MEKMTIKEISPEDIVKVIDLLAEAELDYSDLKQPGIRLFQIVESGLIAAVGALEVRDGQALLRSVTVKKEFRGQGIGKMLVAQIEEVAIQSGIKSLYLLTTTASAFFQSLGYRQINRNDFAEPLKQTAQFAGLCPESAVCMKKEV
jgi:amino-acid N-acetyltransferase